MKQETKKLKNGSALLAEFEKKYKLPKPVICGVIEDIFSKILSERHGRTVLIFFDFDEFRLNYLSYSGITQYSGKIEKTRGLNTILKKIENELLKKSVIRETRHYKQYEGEICDGVIRSIADDGTYHIDASIIPGEIITGVCSIRYQAPHERGRLKIGEKKKFYIRSVTPVLLDDVPRIRLILDRTSKRLVEKLIFSKLSIAKYSHTKVQCVKRIAGGLSIVKASRRLPQDVILWVGEELKERLCIIL